MVQFSVEIPDGDVDRVITAMCVNYRYAAQVPNPDFDPLLDPPDPGVASTIQNPETPHQFANRMTREYLMHNTHAYEVQQAKSDAAHNVPTPPSVTDPN